MQKKKKSKTWSQNSEFHTGDENMGGGGQEGGGGGGAWLNTWEEHGGLKTVLKDNCEGLHLLVKMPAISLQACKFTKNELLPTNFSMILGRF